MVQGLAIPVTGVLSAILDNPSIRMYWGGVGRGAAPIPDMVFEYRDVSGGVGSRKTVQSQPRVVMEIKTTDSMPNSLFDRIINHIDDYHVQLQPGIEDPGKKTQSYYFLARSVPGANAAGQKPGDEPPKRNKDTIILEQVSTWSFHTRVRSNQMWCCELSVRAIRGHGYQ
jgi:hypothetical protein